MSKKAEKAALKAYPEKDCLNKKGTGRYDSNYPRRKAYIQGYEQAEKDMEEKFIQFVHQHYPLNYVGWITDFQKYMEKE